MRLLLCVAIVVQRNTSCYRGGENKGPPYPSRIHPWTFPLYLCKRPATRVTVSGYEEPTESRAEGQKVKSIGAVWVALWCASVFGRLYVAIKNLSKANTPSDRTILSKKNSISSDFRSFLLSEPQFPGKITDLLLRTVVLLSKPWTKFLKKYSRKIVK